MTVKEMGPATARWWAYLFTSPLKTTEMIRLTGWSTNRAATFAYIMFAVGVAPASMAQTSGVAWKFYGGAQVQGQHDECFYDLNGLVRQTNNNIRVWTKCLPQKELDDIDIEKDYEGKILRNTATKMSQLYIPPLAAVEALDPDQAMQVIQYEETASIANIEAHAQVFYELNCHDKMMRELRILVHADGKSGSVNKPGEWKFIPPEGNGARLLKILCMTN